jgi:hypothetical protein
MVQNENSGIVSAESFITIHSQPLLNIFSYKPCVRDSVMVELSMIMMDISFKYLEIQLKTSP